MSVEDAYLRSLNRVLAPIAKSGVLSPILLPAGLIILETAGWRTGRTHRTPLAAAACGLHLLVYTVRGRRAHWVRNLLHEREARYWTGDVGSSVRASVIAPDAAPVGDVPRLVAPLWAGLAAISDVSGCAFALLSPPEA